MVLPEPVSQDRLGGLQVDPVAAEQRPDPGPPGRAEVAQPVFPLGLVGGHEFLGHPVDVRGEHIRDAQSGRADDRCVVGPSPEFLQAPVLEPGSPDAVGAQQRRNGHAALRQPAGVLLRRRRGVHVLQVDAVLHNVQRGGHVFPNAGFEQRQDPPIAPQLRDFPHDQLVNVGRYFSRPGGERTGDVCGALGNGRV